MAKNTRKQGVKVTRGVRMSPNNDAAVRRDAERMDRSVSWVVNMIVTEHYERESVPLSKRLR
jgi:hypothetical protein